MKTAAEDLQIEALGNAGCPVLCLVGDVDMRTAPELRAALQKLFGNRHPQRLVLNLTEVRHMDSSGLSVLLEAWQEARRSNTRFVLAALNNGPRRLLERTRLSDVLETAETLEQAVDEADLQMFDPLLHSFHLGQKSRPAI